MHRACAHLPSHPLEITIGYAPPFLCSKKIDQYQLRNDLARGFSNSSVIKSLVRFIELTKQAYGWVAQAANGFTIAAVLSLLKLISRTQKYDDEVRPLHPASMRMTFSASVLTKDQLLQCVD
jgi:hypothetical protein